MATIAERIVKVVSAELGVSANEVTPDADFAKDLGADSLDQVELAMAFEDEFGVVIPDDDVVDIRTAKAAEKWLLENGVKEG